MLDALPLAHRVFCIPGSQAQVALYWRDDVDAAIVQAGIDTWDFRAYDEQGESPETPIYTDLAKAANAGTPAIMLAAVAITGASPLAIGHTMLHSFNPVTLFEAAARREYMLEYTLRRVTSLQPIVVRVALSMGSAYQ